MDDLFSIDWTDSNRTAGTKTQNLLRENSASSYPCLQPTPPISGRSSPLPPPQLSNGPSSAALPITKGGTSSNDKFANLVPFRTLQSDKTALSLQEQQKALQKKKLAEQEQSRGIGTGVNLGSQDGAFLDSLGSAKTRSNRTAAPPSYAGTDEYGGPKLSKAINKPFAAIEVASRNSYKEASRNRSVDLLLDFDSGETRSKSDELLLHTGVDGGHAINKNRLTQPSSSSNDPLQNGRTRQSFDQGMIDVGSVGDPSSRPGPAVTSSTNDDDDDDDDILGLLGRPVSEFPRAGKAESSVPEPSKDDLPDPSDRALAELIDMGFPLEKSKEALQSTESGQNIQEAVGWLLNQAHAESRMKYKATDNDDHPSSRQRSLNRRRSSNDSQTRSNDDPLPVWMREKGRGHQEQRRNESRSPVNGERDPGNYTADLGNNFFKTANSLWKTGTQKFTKAVSELNSDSDSSQPKWMREAQDRAGARTKRPSDRENGAHRDIGRAGESVPQLHRNEGSRVTDEALLLESGDVRSRPQKAFRQDKSVLPTRSSDSSRDHSPTVSHPPNQSRRKETSSPQFIGQPPFKDIKAKLSRQGTEEESANIYVSPARRKEPAKPLSPEPELLFDASESILKPDRLNRHTDSLAPARTQSPIQAPIKTHVKPPSRIVPSIPPVALRTSASKRQEGSAAFKRGDFALATTYYSTSLAALPPAHPLAIVLFTNRALAHLKTGDPKSSIADAKSAIALIGPSQGALEQIDLGDEGVKEMKLFWAKAMTRQAEGLEQLERWSEAASVWKSCIEAGAGGAVSISGRDRCEKAAAGPSEATPMRKPTIPRKPEPKAVPKISALDALSGYSTQSISGDSTFSNEAVDRLRKANLEAERVDDEKFALSDQVSERLTRWRAGKESNLRALLASLDTVLWEGIGWKKVSMGELIVPSKVKVVYMKGIAKVHPDKVCDGIFSFFLIPFCFFSDDMEKMDLLILCMNRYFQIPLTATTEQRMISAAVFAALNEAWDGFKRANGL